MPEAQLEDSGSGLAPVTECWFVVNVRDAEWWFSERRGARCGFESEYGESPVEFAQLGITRIREPKAQFGLAFLRVRGIQRVRLHADLIMLGRLSLALARARAVPLASAWPLLSTPDGHRASERPDAPGFLAATATTLAHVGKRRYRRADHPGPTHLRPSQLVARVSPISPSRKLRGN